MKSVLQDWVMELGLRHQGVLLAAVRGPDMAPKEDPMKKLVRAYRGILLHSYDPNPSSFIERVDIAELERRMTEVINSFDHYNVHYLLHFIHAAEIVGQKMRGDAHTDRVAASWLWFYHRMCYKMHMRPEDETELDDRLCAGESEFKQASQ